MLQAQNQYAAGQAKAALQLMSKVLACKQDIRMYRFAATYACAARDVAAAKLYYSRFQRNFSAPSRSAVRWKGWTSAMQRRRSRARSRRSRKSRVGTMTVLRCGQTT